MSLFTVPQRQTQPNIMEKIMPKLIDMVSEYYRQSAKYNETMTSAGYLPVDRGDMSEKDFSDMLQTTSDTYKYVKDPYNRQWRMKR